MKNKNLTKKILISALIGLGVGVFVFLTSNLLYGYLQSNQNAPKILNIIAIPGLVLFMITGPIITPFIPIFPWHQDILLVISWIIIGGLVGLIVGLFSKKRV